MARWAELWIRDKRVVHLRAGLAFFYSLELENEGIGNCGQKFLRMAFILLLFLLFLLQRARIAEQSVHPAIVLSPFLLSQRMPVQCDQSADHTLLRLHH